MAFRNKDMSVIAYANGFTLWHYSTQDSFADIENDNKYFTPLAHLMAVGDIIIFNCSDMVGMRRITSLENKTVELGALQ
jgi:hypothetical protein